MDPNIALHTEIYPYNKIVAGLKSIGHKPFQTLKAGEDVDSLAAVYYSPHTPFINKSHTRGLYRTYKYDEGTKSEWIEWIIWISYIRTWFYVWCQ